MHNQSNIERVVMRRVHRVRTLRLVLNGFTASALLLLLAVWGIGREVWVARVLENMPRSGDALAVIRFYLAAFSHTDLAVQALSLLSLASVVYLARATATLIASAVLTPSRA